MTETENPLKSWRSEDAPFAYTYDKSWNDENFIIQFLAHVYENGAKQKKPVLAWEREARMLGEPRIHISIYYNL